MKKQHKLLIFLCLFVLSFSANAQITKRHTFRAVGFMVYGEIGFAPYNYVTDSTTQRLDLYTAPTTFSYSIRRNLFSFNNNVSLSLRIVPSLSVILLNESDAESIKADLPITFGYNWGTAASSESISTRGYGVNVGVNISQLNITQYVYNAFYFESPTTVTFHTAFSYRLWNTFFFGHGASEIELRCSFRPGNDNISPYYVFQNDFHIEEPRTLNMPHLLSLGITYRAYIKY
jgi:hypothetical protein